MSEFISGAGPVSKIPGGDEKADNKGMENPFFLKKDAPPLVFKPLDVAFAVIMLVMGFLMIKLVFSSDQGLGVSVFTLLFCGTLIYWFRANQIKLPRASYLYLGLILITGLYFLIFDNPLLKSLALILLIFMVIYYVMSVTGLRTGKRLDQYLGFDLFDGLLGIPFAHLSSGPKILNAHMKSTKNGRNILFLIAGLILAIPVCVFVVSLLQSADAAFEHLWNKLSYSFFSDAIKNIFQLILAIPIACYLFGLLYGSKNQAGQALRQEAEALAALEKARFLPGLLVIGLITPLLILYLIFFFSQSAYFLAAFSGLLPEGFSYSEYARRGFFELCTVSGINFAFILVLLLLTKKSQGKSRLYQIYSTLLSLFSLALIIMSLRKMLLYIDIYGLTPLRLYTSWFMVLLLLLFIFSGIQSFSAKFVVLKWGAIATVAMFLILCFSNPDLQIARYNVEGYASGKLEQLDVSTLSSLGDSATPYLLEVIEMGKTSAEQKDTAHDILQFKLGRLDQEDWRSFSLAGWFSQQSLREYESKYGVREFHLESDEDWYERDMVLER